MTDIKEPIRLNERTVLGKGLATIRGEGMVPAVLHNHGQPSLHVMAPKVELEKIYQIAGKHHPLQLEVAGKSYLALIKDVHFNPVKRYMQHVVFQAIEQNETVEAEVPVRLSGDPPAEKVGLIVLHQLDNVEVEALPKDLPDELVISAESLAELHDKITVADLQVPNGVTVLTDPEHTIATVVESRAQLAEEAEAEEAEEGEETEAGEEEPGKEQPAEEEQA